MCTRQVVPSDDLGDHLAWLMRAFDAHALRGVRDVDEIHITIVHLMTRDMGGVDLPEAFIEYAAAIHASVGVSVTYCATDTE